MNRGQLKTRVARIVGIGLGTDDDGVAEGALLEELANEAVVDILSRTRVHVREATIPLDADCSEFEIDDSILRIWGLKRKGSDGSTGILSEGSRDTLEASEYAFPGLSRIELGQQAAAGDTIIAWYTPAPTPMTLDAHDPSAQTYGRVPPQFHRAILDYMCWHAADKAEDQGSARGERYRIRYEGQDGMGGPGTDLGRIKVAVNERGGSVRVVRNRRTLIGDQIPRYWQG